MYKQCGMGRPAHVLTMWHGRPRPCTNNVAWASRPCTSFHGRDAHATRMMTKGQDAHATEENVWKRPGAARKIQVLASLSSQG